MEELEYKLRLYVQTIITREMLPQIEHFEALEKEMLARVDTMVDKRVSAVQKQYDQKMKEIEAKNNAMLRMQMLELQRKTSAPGRAQSIGAKKNSVQEKVEPTMKQVVLAGLVNNRSSLEVEKSAPETVASEQMAQTMP